VALERVDDLFLEAERARKNEAQKKVVGATEKVQRALKLAGEIESAVDKHVTKLQRTVNEFLDELEGFRDKMKEAVPDW